MCQNCGLFIYTFYLITRYSPSSLALFFYHLSYVLSSRSLKSILFVVSLSLTGVQTRLAILEIHSIYAFDLFGPVYGYSFWVCSLATSTQNHINGSSILFVSIKLVSEFISFFFFLKKGGFKLKYPVVNSLSVIWRHSLNFTTRTHVMNYEY